MPASYRLKLTRGNALKLRTSLRIPAQLAAGTGLVLTKANGIFTFDLDYSELGEIAVLASDRDNLLVAVWNEDTDTFSLVALDTLLGAGTIAQAWDADLDALAALSGTNTIYYRSAANTWTAVTIGGMLSFSAGTLNIGDAELTAIAGLTSAADKLPYFNGSGTAALADFTTLGRTLAALANAAAGRTALGLVIGTDVQAFHARLADLAGITYAQGDVLYFNGTNLVKLSPGTSGHFLKTLGAAANPAWAAVPGGGDMLASNNLSDVTTPATAFANIKQAASDTATGAIEIAVQSELEAASSNTLCVTPGRMKYHPGVMKVGALVDIFGGTGFSYGVSSVSDSGTGFADVTFTTSFGANTLMCVSLSVVGASTDQACNWGQGSLGATVRMHSITASTGALVDPTYYTLFVGGDLP